MHPLHVGLFSYSSAFRSWIMAILLHWRSAARCCCIGYEIIFIPSERIMRWGLKENVHNTCLQSDVWYCTAALCGWFMRASQWLSCLQRDCYFPPSLMVHSSFPLYCKSAACYFPDMLEKRDTVWLIYMESLTLAKHIHLSFPWLISWWYYSVYGKYGGE